MRGIWTSRVCFLTNKKKLPRLLLLVLLSCLLLSLSLFLPAQLITSSTISSLLVLPLFHSLLLSVLFHFLYLPSSPLLSSIFISPSFILIHFFNFFCKDFFFLFCFKLCFSSSSSLFFSFQGRRYACSCILLRYSDMIFTGLFCISSSALLPKLAPGFAFTRSAFCAKAILSFGCVLIFILRFCYFCDKNFLFFYSVLFSLAFKVPRLFLLFLYLKTKL